MLIHIPYMEHIGEGIHRDKNDVCSKLEMYHYQVSWGIYNKINQGYHGDVLWDM